VTLSSPLTPNATPAIARARLRDLGTLRRIRIDDPGCIYPPSLPPPKVTFSPPPDPEGRRAQGVAVLDGQGGIQAVLIQDRGSGYRSDVPISVSFTIEEAMAAEPPDAVVTANLCGRPARATALVDREVASVEVLEGGSGYVAPMGLQVCGWVCVSSRDRTKASLSIPAPACQVNITPPGLAGGEADGKPAKAIAVLARSEDSPPGAVPMLTYSPASLTAQLQQLLPLETALDYDLRAKR
jgi:hypothetical protein